MVATHSLRHLPRRAPRSRGVSRPLLIVGANGQLGRELAAEASEQGIATIAVGREELDVTQEEAVQVYVRDARPRAIVNCAAYTAVDQAESDTEAAHAINALGPEHLARACAGLDVPLLHVSTDYVFDGTKHSAYIEEDPVAPLGTYGRTKEEG